MASVGFCSVCGAVRSAGAEFCASCGHRFEAVVPDLAQVGVGAQRVVLGTPAAPAAPARKRRSRAWRLLVGALLVLIVLAAAAGIASGGAGFGNVGAASHDAVVVYTLTGSATGASLTYTDGSGNIQQQTSVAVPLTRASGGSGITLHASHGAFVSFSAQNQGASGDLNCAIAADGVVFNTGHSNGGYAIVSCSGKVP